MMHLSISIPVKSPCDICKKELFYFQGTLFFNNFIPYLNDVSRKFCPENLSTIPLVNASIKSYFEQFPTLSELLPQDAPIDQKLEVLLKNNPQKHAGIILHDLCFPRDYYGIGYMIDLRDMSTQTSSEEVKNKISKWPWFNERGWPIIKNNLFKEN